MHTVSTCCSLCRESHWPSQTLSVTFVLETTLSTRRPAGQRNWCPVQTVVAQVREGRGGGGWHLMLLELIFQGFVASVCACVCVCAHVQHMHVCINACL